MPLDVRVLPHLVPGAPDQAHDALELLFIQVGHHLVTLPVELFFFTGPRAPQTHIFFFIDLAVALIDPRVRF